MSLKEFTENEIEILKKNKNIKNISKKGITYTDDLKSFAVTELEKGKTPRQIFESAGFDVQIIGMKRVSTACDRWKRSYSKKGIIGLTDTRKGNSGRPTTRDLTAEEKLERAELKIEMLQMENELLKKIELAERRLRKRK